MSWAVGYDSNWERDVGYGVPCKCDHPACDKDIDRGLGYVCGGDLYGGDEGCGLFFCGEHASAYRGLCERCRNEQEPFDPKPDTRDWIEHKLSCPTWQRWRAENPKVVDEIRRQLAEPSP